MPAPKTLPTAPTPDSVIRDAMATNVDTLLAVPAMVEVCHLSGLGFPPVTQRFFVQAWSYNPEYVRWLAGRRGVVCTLAPQRLFWSDLECPRRMAEVRSARKEATSWSPRV